MAAFLVPWKRVVRLSLLRDDQGGLKRGIGVAGLCALSCLGLHSLVDFGLNIPANAMSFAVLLGLVWVARELPEERRTRSTRRREGALTPDDR